MRAKRFAVLGLLAALTAARAGDVRALGRSDVGTSGAQFLKIGPGARPVAMGEAFSGVADDIHAIYYNPAGLAHLEDVQVGAMHHSSFQDINYEFGAIAIPMLSWVDTKEPHNSNGVAGLAIYNLNVGNIERRGTTETDTPTGTFGAGDFAYELAYAYAFSKQASLGGGIKFIDQNLDTAKATAVALDFGGLYREGRYSLGAGFRHFGTKPKFAGEADPLPLRLYLGGGVRSRENWLFSADVRVPRDNSAGLSLGGEYTQKFSKELSGSLRGGFNTSNRDADGLTGISLGGGIGYDHWSFDFAWVPFGDLGNTFRYSLVVRF